MYNIFLKEHIKNISKEENPRGLLLVYKGFPLDFVFNIGREFAFLNEAGQIFNGNRIDLQKVVDCSKKTIKKLLSIDRGIYAATYEELVAILRRVQDLSLFEGRIVIFDNNLFKQYPNQTSSHFPNLDEVVEGNDLNYQEDDLLNQFYVYSDVKFGLTLLQYKEIDVSPYDNVAIREFFDEELVRSQTLDYRMADADQIAGKAIPVSEQDENYFSLKYALFDIKLLDTKSVNLVTDLVTLRNEKQEAELKLLKLIYTANGYEFNVGVKSSKPSTQYRQDFKDLLLKYWGSSSFRELTFYKDPDRTTEKYTIEQGALIEEIVQEVEKAIDNKDFNDIFITSPTGAGKSLLFQIPAIYLHHKYGLVTIIVSPLIALMYDQVMALRVKGIEFVAYINSSISLVERENIIDKIKKGEISVLYLSPELLLSYDVRHFIGERSIGLLVIDEAHLVTTWGRDFRVDYWYLGTYIKRVRDPKYMGSSFPVLAVTATAVYGGPDDIVFETVENLNMRAPRLHIGNSRRDKIRFDLRPFQTKGNHELVKLNKTGEIVIGNIKDGVKTIVYFPWRNQIKLLMQDLPSDIKYKAGEYYSDVEATRKQIVADKFQRGDIFVVLATKAFGMGIDVSDIQMIYHHAPSGNLSDYIQEVGRVARSKDIKGTAVIDFCEKDLKFTKILYGLSSIKQYQVKYVLQKISDLYKKYQRRQMLVSAEDFGFIFANVSSDLETKVKSALLLLEKDLYLKVNNQYNILIVRPKNLFSTVFACVPKNIEDRFITKYDEYCKVVSTIGFNKRRDTKTLTKHDIGNIYELQLDKIWERYFSGESFPSTKYKFFNQELFTEFEEQPHPRYKLEIALRYTPQDTLRRIEECFAVLDEAFRNVHNESFSGEELRRVLHKHFGDEVLARRVTNLLTNLYSSGFEPDQFSSKKIPKGTFLRTERSDKGEPNFRIIDSRYIQEKAYLIRKFSLMFDTNRKSFEKFLATSDTETEFRIKIAYLIESLLLGSYELRGGKLSQIFIRINDPYKLTLFAIDPKYSNSVVQDIERRHERSIKQMGDFFHSQVANKQRWDYIENYFLGKLEDIN